MKEFKDGLKDRKPLKPLSPKALARLKPSVSPIDLISQDNSPIKTNKEKSVRVVIIRKGQHERN